LKTLKELGSECFKQFVEGHPELQFQTNNQEHQMMNADRAGYAKIGIDFALKYYEDELALKKDGKALPIFLKFKLDGEKYVQEGEE